MINNYVHYTSLVVVLTKRAQFNLGSHQDPNSFLMKTHLVNKYVIDTFPHLQTTHWKIKHQ